MVNTRCGCLTPCKAVKCHINSTNTNAQKCSQTCSVCTGQNLQAMDLFTLARPLKFLIVQATPSKLIKYFENSYVRNQNCGSTRPFDSFFPSVGREKRKNCARISLLKIHSEWVIFIIKAIVKLWYSWIQNYSKVYYIARFWRKIYVSKVPRNVLNYESQRFERSYEIFLDFC